MYAAVVADVPGWADLWGLEEKVRLPITRWRISLLRAQVWHSLRFRVLSQSLPRIYGLAKVWRVLSQGLAQCAKYLAQILCVNKILSVNFYISEQVHRQKFICKLFYICELSMFTNKKSDFYL